MTEKQFKTITKKLHFYNQGGIKNLCTMTETTLRQVMEEAAGVTQAYIRKLAQNDIDQQNKIALLSAKVYKLQKEVEEIKANADYQLEGRDLEIKELKAQIEKMKRCEICKHYRWNHCSYETNISADCIQNKLKHFELKELKEK